VDVFPEDVVLFFESHCGERVLGDALDFGEHLFYGREDQLVRVFGEEERGGGQHDADEDGPADAEVAVEVAFAGLVEVCDDEDRAFAYVVFGFDHGLLFVATQTVQVGRSEQAGRVGQREDFVGVVDVV